MKNVFGDRYISISREISKKYEEIYRGNISQLIDKIVLKGQFVIVVSGSINDEIDENYNDEIKELIDNGMKSNDAIKMIAKKYNLKKDEVYKEFHGIGDNK